MNKEKTLGLLSERICEQCAKEPNAIIKHGCCQHFIVTAYNEFFYSGPAAPVLFVRIDELRKSIV